MYNRIVPRPVPDGGRPGQVRITVLSCAKHPPRYPSGVVVVSAPGDMRGLNQRELEILGLLVEDWSDQCISAAMGLPLPVVVENVRAHPGETRRRNARPWLPCAQCDRACTRAHSALPAPEPRTKVIPIGGNEITPDRGHDGVSLKRRTQLFCSRKGTVPP
jgi:hypothetical protein